MIKTSSGFVAFTSGWDFKVLTFFFHYCSLPLLVTMVLQNYILKAGKIEVSHRVPVRNSFVSKMELFGTILFQMLFWKRTSVCVQVNFRSIFSLLPLSPFQNNNVKFIEWPSVAGIGANFENFNTFSFWIFLDTNLR